MVTNLRNDRVDASRTLYNGSHSYSLYRTRMKLLLWRCVSMILLLTKDVDECAASFRKHKQSRFSCVEMVGISDEMFTRSNTTGEQQEDK